MLNRMTKKGIASWITQMLIALFTVGSVAFLYFLIYGRYIDVHAIIESSEAQRHTINIAQVLLSSDKLVYEEDFGGGFKRFHRGVFDKSKLDAQMINEEQWSIFSDVTKDSDIVEEIGYPNSAISIIVNDIETDERWILSYTNPGLEWHNEYMDCMANNIDTSFFGFPTLGNSYILWNYWDEKECSDTYNTKIGVFEKDFPVLIQYGDTTHAARLMVKLMEV